MGEFEVEASRDVAGLLRVTRGGAQLRPIGNLCPLCETRGQCLQLIRLQIIEGAGGNVFAARRHCDDDTVFSAVPVRARPVDGRLSHG